MKAVTIFLLALPMLAQDVPWQARLQYIEACSCDLFCPCYFNDHASHQGSGEHKCTFNNVARVVAGKHGAVDLTGVKVWLSGDLGADWGTKGQADWLVATFEPKTTKDQKEGMMAILTKVSSTRNQKLRDVAAELLSKLPGGEVRTHFEA